MRPWPALTLTFPSRESVSDSFLPLQDQASALLDGLEIVAIEEYTDDRWRICFRDATARDRAVTALDGLVAAGLSVEACDVPDEDWARRSQAAIQAIRVGGVIVAPPWDDAATSPAPDALTIIIEPGMGFGSGHHATTRLCLQALQRLVPRARVVLDIGTGSGVLAIAAALLGASTVLGVDVDPDALESALTNAGLNGDPAGLAFRQADFRTVQLPHADIVVANLTGAMLASAAEEVLRCCRPGGMAILSGITAEEAAEVTAAFASRAVIEWRGAEDGWIALIVATGLSDQKRA